MLIQKLSVEKEFETDSERAVRTEFSISEAGFNKYATFTANPNFHMKNIGQKKKKKKPN